MSKPMPVNAFKLDVPRNEDRNGAKEPGNTCRFWLVDNEVEIVMTICVFSFIAMIFLMSDFLLA